MKKTLIFLIILFFIFNCNKLFEPELGECPDTRLIGTWEYSFYTNWNGGLYERYQYEKWIFDDNNKCSHYSKYWSYTETGGWINAAKKSYDFEYEWKIENNKIKYKLWDIDDKWYEKSFEYINSTKIKIDFKEFIKQ